MHKFLFTVIAAGCLMQSHGMAATFGSVNAVTPDLPPKGMAVRPDKDPLKSLDELIAVTDKSAAEQKQLRRQLIDYFKIKSQHLQDQQNKEVLVQMIQAAFVVQKMIDSLHLSHVFDAELLDELKFFSQIAAKKGIHRP